MTLDRDELQKILDRVTALPDDLATQLDAWDIDFEAFAALLGQWTEEAAARLEEAVMPDGLTVSMQGAMAIAFVGGFETGYLMHAEAEMKRVQSEPMGGS